MRISIASSSLVAIPTLELLEKSDHEICSYITTPDAPSGRGRVLSPNPFAAYLEGRGIDPVKGRDMNFLKEHLEGTRPDLVITIAYGQLIPERLLLLPRNGWLNLHFSLLPAWRGAAPVQRCILAGDSATGVTVFALDKGMDTGPIYTTRVLHLDGNETTPALLASLSGLGASAVVAALEKIQSHQQPTPQSNVGISLAPKISSTEAKIDWSGSAVEIERKVRAMLPKPGAWSEIGPLRFTITSSTAMDVEENETSAKLSAGEISRDDGLVIGCGKGFLKIRTLIPAGKREMSSEEWLRGSDIAQGTICG